MGICSHSTIKIYIGNTIIIEHVTAKTRPNSLFQGHSSGVSGLTECSRCVGLSIWRYKRGEVSPCGFTSQHVDAHKEACARGTAALMGKERRNEGAARESGASRWPWVSGECSSPVRCGGCVTHGARYARCASTPPPLLLLKGGFLCCSCSGFSVENALDRDIRLEWD